MTVIKKYNENTTQWEADVVGWLTAKDGWAEALEARLDADIENQKNPPVLHGVPWAGVEAEASE